MPNRIIKESICTSENLNDLSPEEEVFFYRLMVNCDDFGRLDARANVIRAKCFPLKLDEVKDDQILQWLESLSNHNLLSVYSVNGSGKFLQIITWENHQQVRAKRSKYPAPDNTCNQLIADDDNSPRNPIQSLSESLSESLSLFQNIFNIWNEQKIIVHKNLTPEINTAIKNALSHYSEDDLTETIKNYGLVVNSADYWFDYKWTLKDFLKRGIEKFTDLETAKSNYKVEKNGESTGKTQQNPGNKPSGAFDNI